MFTCVNVFGAIRLIRAVAPVMRRQGHGRIVNISSIIGRLSLPANGGYSATEFARTTRTYSAATMENLASPSAFERRQKEGQTK
jgi:NAD(P)-dependent dehydrogenase (short-subunit alcohol dehydrogenase family)